MVDCPNTAELAEHRRVGRVGQTQWSWTKIAEMVKHNRLAKYGRVGGMVKYSRTVELVEVNQRWWRQ